MQSTNVTNPKRFLRLIISPIILVIAAIFLLCPHTAYANTTYTVSPMYQNMLLLPGQTETGSFRVSNPAANDSEIEYELIIKPFSYNENNEAVLESKDDYSQIVNWVTLTKTSGTVAPNESDTIIFTIDVPDDAPTGGQYFAIIVHPVVEEVAGTMNSVIEIAHLVYTEVAGTTSFDGEIGDIELPSFVISGNIAGNATVTNQGNVHSYAKQTLQVFPLFSNEEYFTNEETPDEVFVMPETSRYMSFEWEQTPPIGIFHLVYTVEFAGLTKQISKYVFVCPLWFLIILIIFLVLLIAWFVLGRKIKSKKTA